MSDANNNKCNLFFFNEIYLTPGQHHRNKLATEQTCKAHVQCWASVSIPANPPNQTSIYFLMRNRVYVFMKSFQKQISDEILCIAIHDITYVYVYICRNVHIFLIIINTVFSV